MFGSFDRYSGGKGADAASYLELHGGRQLVIDRKGGVPPVLYVPRASVSITGTIQPDILRRALGSQHRQSGLAARFLFAYPPRLPRRWTDEQIDPVLVNDVAKLVGRLFELPMQIDESGETYPLNLSLTGDAQRAFIAFFNAHGSEQDKMIGDTAAAFSKLEGYAARFTLIHHCCLWAAEDTPPTHEQQIGIESVNAGITLARWFANEALHIYAMLDESEQDRSERELVEWIKGRGGRVTARDVQRGPSQFRQDSVTIGKLLDGMVSKGIGCWEELETGKRGGRPSRTFVLND